MAVLKLAGALATEVSHSKLMTSPAEAAVVAAAVVPVA